MRRLWAAPDPKKLTCRRPHRHTPAAGPPRVPPARLAVPSVVPAPVPLRAGAAAAPHAGFGPPARRSTPLCRVAPSPPPPPPSPPPAHLPAAMASEKVYASKEEQAATFKVLRVKPGNQVRCRCRRAARQPPPRPRRSPAPPPRLTHRRPPLPQRRRASTATPGTRRGRPSRMASSSASTAPASTAGWAPTSASCGALGGGRGCPADCLAAGPTGPAPHQPAHTAPRPPAAGQRTWTSGRRTS
jgi:hypothetical protein